MNVQVFLIILNIHCGVYSINFKNNECSKISDYHIAAFSTNCQYNRDVLSDVPSMVRHNGYLVETHTLTTRSGYILHMYRIKSDIKSEKSYPIMVVHGIAAETGTWTNIGNRSLAFNLLEAGYDVWLASLRGTADSYKHTTWNINNPSYWTFSLDELVKEDMDIQLTYIYQMTNQKVLIVGHSMGTTLSFMYASEYFEKADQVLRGIVALAPVAYLDGNLLIKHIGIKPPLILFDILDKLRIRGLLYQAKFIHTSIITICKILPEVCYGLLTRLSGRTHQFLPNDLLLFFSYWPSGTSVRQLKHYFQIPDSKNFQKYDFGNARENQKHYNTSKPPLYNLSNVKVPVCLYYGRRDILYVQRNMERLYNELGSRKKFMTSVPINVSKNLEFCHIDFINSAHIVEYLYVPMLEKLKTFFN